MPKFFKKTPRKNMPISSQGFADGLAGMAKALETLDVVDGYVDWAHGRPVIVTNGSGIDFRPLIDGDFWYTVASGGIHPGSFANSDSTQAALGVGAVVTTAGGITSAGGMHTSIGTSAAALTAIDNYHTAELCNDDEAGRFEDAIGTLVTVADGANGAEFTRASSLYEVQVLANNQCVYGTNTFFSAELVSPRGAGQFIDGLGDYRATLGFGYAGYFEDYATDVLTESRTVKLCDKTQAVLALAEDTNARLVSIDPSDKWAAHFHDTNTLDWCKFIFDEQVMEGANPTGDNTIILCSTSASVIAEDGADEHRATLADGSQAGLFEDATGTSGRITKLCDDTSAVDATDGTYTAQLVNGIQAASFGDGGTCSVTVCDGIGAVSFTGGTAAGTLGDGTYALNTSAGGINVATSVYHAAGITGKAWRSSFDKGILIGDSATFESDLGDVIEAYLQSWTPSPYPSWFDHGELAGLSDDDHLHYWLVGGDYTRNTAVSGRFNDGSIQVDVNVSSVGVMATDLTSTVDLINGTSCVSAIRGVYDISLATATEALSATDGTRSIALCDGTYAADATGEIRATNGVYVGSIGDAAAAGDFTDGTRTALLCDGVNAGAFTGGTDQLEICDGTYALNATGMALVTKGATINSAQDGTASGDFIVKSNLFSEAFVVDAAFNDVYFGGQLGSTDTSFGVVIGDNATTSRFQVGRKVSVQQWSGAVPYIYWGSVDNEVATNAFTLEDENLNTMVEIWTGGDGGTTPAVMSIYGELIVDGVTETKAGVTRAETTVTGNTTLTSANHIVSGDTDGGAFTITLPAGASGAEYEVGNTGTSGNDITLAPNGTDDILGNGAGVSFTIYDGEWLTLKFISGQGWR
jgi:hypothetical protein